MAAKLPTPMVVVVVTLRPGAAVREFLRPGVTVKLPSTPGRYTDNTPDEGTCPPTQVQADKMLMLVTTLAYGRISVSVIILYQPFAATPAPQAFARTTARWHQSQYPVANLPDRRAEHQAPGTPRRVDSGSPDMVIIAAPFSPAAAVAAVYATAVQNRGIGRGARDVGRRAYRDAAFHGVTEADPPDHAVRLQESRRGEVGDGNQPPS